MKTVIKYYHLLTLAVIAKLVKVHVWALAWQQKVQDNPFERRLMKASAGTTFLSLFLLTSTAHADGGLAAMVETGANQGEAIKGSAGKLFAAVGFCLAGWGGYNWWVKSKEGENSRIKGSQIWGPIVAGAVLGATGYVLIKAGETIGIQGSSQGQLPQ